MRADALADFGAGTKEICRVDLDETAGFRPPFDLLQALQLAAVAVIARRHEPADDAGAESALVDEGEGRIVVARGKTRAGALATDRDQRAELEFIVRRALE